MRLLLVIQIATLVVEVFGLQQCERKWSSEESVDTNIVFDTCVPLTEYRLKMDTLYIIRVIPDHQCSCHINMPLNTSILDDDRKCVNVWKEGDEETYTYIGYYDSCTDSPTEGCGHHDMEIRLLYGITASDAGLEAEISCGSSFDKIYTGLQHGSVETVGPHQLMQPFFSDNPADQCECTFHAGDSAMSIHVFTRDQHRQYHTRTIQVRSFDYMIHRDNRCTFVYFAITGPKDLNYKFKCGIPTRPTLPSCPTTTNSDCDYSTDIQPTLELCSNVIWQREPVALGLIIGLSILSIFIFCVGLLIGCCCCNKCKRNEDDKQKPSTDITPGVTPENYTELLPSSNQVTHPPQRTDTTASSNYTYIDLEHMDNGSAPKEVTPASVPQFTNPGYGQYSIGDPQLIKGTPYPDKQPNYVDPSEIHSNQASVVDRPKPRMIPVIPSGDGPDKRHVYLEVDDTDAARDDPDDTGPRDVVMVENPDYQPFEDDDDSKMAKTRPSMNNETDNQTVDVSHDKDPALDIVDNLDYEGYPDEDNNN